MDFDDDELKIRPQIDSNSLTLYVVKSTPTSTTNFVKVLIAIEELSIPHNVFVLQSTSKQTWFHKINPHRMVPAMEDTEVRNGRRLNVFESTACLIFLVDKYDSDGVLGGKGLWERTQINNWLTLHTAALGPTSKWWLWFKKMHAGEGSESVVERLSTSIRQQYDILEARLSEPGQEYIALPDRPTIADIANLPFANEKIAATADYDFNDWPRLKAWSERMLGRPAVQRAYQRGSTFGHEPDSDDE
ncbi:glutathione S-transferase [Aspergillus leporis]|uniref:glutathione transferase n=1 Tax=Aspergillus leporis TaxID=41062 RepID=A0A5N5WQ06_9EURO|nr:glutathione S-transferase [Aspergillus leporis]